MGKGSPRKLNIGRSIALVILGFALGSAATYLVLSAGLRSSEGASETPSLTHQPEFLGPVREALLPHGVELNPGLPPGLSGPPERLSLQLPGEVPAQDLPVWWGHLPEDESLLRLNGRLTQAVSRHGGEILASWEEIPGGREERPDLRSPISVPYRTRIPGTDPRATLWLGIGREGEPDFLLCLRRGGPSRS
jgi:hypothetical protein